MKPEDVKTALHTIYCTYPHEGLNTIRHAAEVHIKAVAWNALQYIASLENSIDNQRYLTGELRAQMQELHCTDGEILEKGAEPAHYQDTMHLLALSVERLTRQLEPATTEQAEPITLDADDEWKEEAPAGVGPMTSREYLIQALELINHCVRWEQYGPELLRFANRAEEAMHLALDVLPQYAVMGYTSPAQLLKPAGEQREVHGQPSERFCIPVYRNCKEASL